ncbi:hypothetical protein CLOM621_05903 [Clostridium sp. M62/1]|nr:hypothetical protein CLOM621_05903 [Clostridium sp. M62/1]
MSRNFQLKFAAAIGAEAVRAEPAERPDYPNLPSHLFPPEKPEEKRVSDYEVFCWK